MRSWRAALALSLAAAAVAVLVALAVRADGPPQRLAASTTTASPAPAPTAEATPTPVPTAIPEVAFGTELEGGRTYALPGGAWIFDVPEGIRLRYNSYEGENPPNGFGFKDQVTGSLITVYLRDDGSFTFYGLNYGRTPAARQLADAWLPAVEASFRRPPGYVEPSPTPTAEATPSVPPDIPVAIPEVAFGTELDGGRTYALPGGAWIFDVPEGIRLRYNSYEGENPPNGFGFKDQVTGSLITVYLRDDGSFTFYGLNYGRTPAARQLADAWLPAIEASFRRPPGYVEPAAASGASGAADEGPGTNPDGVPYLRDYQHSEEAFAGGYTYATPDGRWLVEIPAGLRVYFYEHVSVGHEGVNFYSFEDVATGDEIFIYKNTGALAAEFFGSSTGTTNSQLRSLLSSLRRR